MNNNRQKKIAPRAATPETKNTKNVSINSILLNNPKIKCVLQRTDECFSRPVRLGDVPQTFISGKIICEDLNEPKTGGLKLLTLAKSTEPLTLSANGKAYYGAALIVSFSRMGRIRDMTAEEIQTARAWLLRHRV